VGKWITGKVQGKQANGWFQMRAVDHIFGSIDYFTGAPIWDDQLDGIIGIMAGYTYDDSICSMAPTELLLRALPSIRLVEQSNTSTKASGTVAEQVREGKPAVFVGSSVEGLSVAYAMQSLLERDAEMTAWDQGVFQMSNTALVDLLAVTTRMDFGIFVFNPDDISHIRKKQYLTVRDNVVFELGLFIGALGKDRCFIVIPREVPALHLPTDLLGVKPASYDPNRTDGNLKAALGPAANEIRSVM
jgi:predicted nucleotide-binding protein